MPTVTVFTPTYNRAHTLRRTYESLCTQTCTDFCWLIVDDGSTDFTERLVQQWIQAGRLPIRYIKKKNGGLYTGYNTAYTNIDTPLSLCCDSDDFLPDDAIEIIVNTWLEHGSDKYAGIIGLDFDANNMQPIGGYFPLDLRECYLLDLYTKKIHIGDTKCALRTDLMRAVAPMVGYEGEKNFNPIYLMLQVCDEYPLIVVNKNLCCVDYQTTDSMSAHIFQQYFDSPRSFSKLRRLEMGLKRSGIKNRIRVTIHYVATSIIARDKSYIAESPRPVLTTLLTPIGALVYLYLKHKAKR